MELQHRINLAKLAVGLWDRPQEHFHMRQWMLTDDGYGTTPKDAVASLTNCGTVACAVGHAPAILCLKVESHWHWLNIVQNWFGLLLGEGSDDFEFMFGSHWFRVDDTPRGASQRIVYFLSGGDLKRTEAYKKMTLEDIPEDLKAHL